LAGTRSVGTRPSINSHVNESWESLFPLGIICLATQAPCSFATGEVASLLVRKPEKWRSNTTSPAFTDCPIGRSSTSSRTTIGLVSRTSEVVTCRLTWLLFNSSPFSSAIAYRKTPMPLPSLICTNPRQLGSLQSSCVVARSLKGKLTSNSWLQSGSTNRLSPSLTSTLPAGVWNAMAAASCICAVAEAFIADWSRSAIASVELDRKAAVRSPKQRLTSHGTSRIRRRAGCDKGVSAASLINRV
jgi:hypothetical protein